jgi:DNA phosphorothioation-dependent restriction protein DptG
VAKVIPVYKKGSPLLVSNYRPISLLSIFNKILERLMYNRLIKYFEQSSVFFDQQFGFRSNHSTVHALILIVDKIQKAIDS